MSANFMHGVNFIRLAGLGSGQGGMDLVLSCICHLFVAYLYCCCICISWFRSSQSGIDFVQLIWSRSGWHPALPALVWLNFMPILYLSCICLVFVLYLSCICLAFVLHLSCVCLAFVSSLPWIFLVFVCYICVLYLSWILYLFFLSRSVNSMPEMMCHIPFWSY